VLLGRALAARWRSLWRPGFADEMREVGAELDELAIAAPGAGLDLEAATCLHVAHLTLADVPAAEVALERAIGYARERRLIQFEAQLLPNLATIRLLKGDVAGGRQVFDDVVTRWERVQFPLEGAQRALLLWIFGKETGDLDEAAVALETHLSSYFPFWSVVAAQCRGDVDAARSNFVGEGLGVVRPLFDGTATAAREAEVAADLGDHDVAARAAVSLKPYVGEIGAIGTAGVYGPIAVGLGRALATVGRKDEAARAFRTAIDLADRNGLRASSIWARLRLAEVLPERADAVQLAGAAAHEAATLGLLVAAQVGEQLCAQRAGSPAS
jgi:tetratricopeptide (TPR) repeat protein